MIHPTKHSSDCRTHMYQIFVKQKTKTIRQIEVKGRKINIHSSLSLYLFSGKKKELLSERPCLVHMPRSEVSEPGGT